MTSKSLMASMHFTATRAAWAFALGLLTLACSSGIDVEESPAIAPEVEPAGDKSSGEGGAGGSGGAGEPGGPVCESPVPEGTSYPQDILCKTDADCPPSPNPCLQVFCGLYHCAESYPVDGQKDACGPGLWCEEQTPDDFTYDVACCSEPPKCISLYDSATKTAYQCESSDLPGYRACEGDHSLCVVEGGGASYACCR